MEKSRVFFGIALGTWILASGCGPSRADMKRLQDRLARLQATLESEREEHAKTSKKLRNRIARLEAELAVVRRKLAVRVAPGPRPPTRPAADPERPSAAEPKASCPKDLPEAARKLRRRMRVAKARKLLSAVKLRVTKKIVITGRGTRTRAVWSGPCFRVTVDRGRIVSVALEGAAPRRRSRRRRRRKRRRRR